MNLRIVLLSGTTKSTLQGKLNSLICQYLMSCLKSKGTHALVSMALSVRFIYKLRLRVDWIVITLEHL